MIFVVAIAEPISGLGLCWQTNGSLFMVSTGFYLLQRVHGHFEKQSDSLVSRGRSLWSYKPSRPSSELGIAK
jgi:hypothetical protein